MKPIAIRVKEDYDFLDTAALIDTAIQKVGLPASILIKKEEVGISEKQRKYYFGVVVTHVMDYHGMTKDQAHQFLKRSFLPEYEEILDEMIQCEDKNDMKSMLVKFLSLYSDLTITTESTWRFERYLKDIRFEYSHHWVFIPLPNESEQWEGWEMMK